MKRIMTAWLLQLNANPTVPEFDPQAAAIWLKHLYSPYSEPRLATAQAVCRYLLQWAPLFILPTLAYMMLVAFLVGRSARRKLGIAAGLLLFFLLLCFFPNKTTNRLFPGSNAFMRDVVFIPGVDVTQANPNRGNTITLYCVHDSLPDRRLGIAFGDGHVQWTFFERAKPLFEAQGIPFPRPSE